MNAFKLLVAGVATAALLYVFFYSFAGLFNPQENLSMELKQVLSGAESN